MTDWCILLCGSTSTLRLLDSLTEAEFDVWAPVAHEKQPSGEMERKAMLPGFVFARVGRLLDLHDLVRSPVQVYRAWNPEKRRMEMKNHPYFRILRNPDGYSLMPERELSHLREAERKKKPRGSVRKFVVGDKVRLTEGAYGGLRGEVVAIRGKEAVVSFTESAFVRDAQVGMWLLLDDMPTVHVNEQASEQAPHAKAA